MSILGKKREILRFITDSRLTDFLLASEYTTESELIHQDRLLMRRGIRRLSPSSDIDQSKNNDLPNTGMKQVTSDLG